MTDAYIQTILLRVKLGIPVGPMMYNEWRGVSLAPRFWLRRRTKRLMFDAPVSYINTSIWPF